MNSCTGTVATTDRRRSLTRRNAMICLQVHQHNIDGRITPTSFSHVKRDVSDISVESFLTASYEITKLNDKHGPKENSTDPTDEGTMSVKCDLDEASLINSDVKTCTDTNTTRTISRKSRRHLRIRCHRETQDIVSAQPPRVCFRRTSSIDDTPFFFTNTIPQKLDVLPTQTLMDALKYCDLYTKIRTETPFHKIFCETHSDTVPMLPRRKDSIHEG
jgi:hypothetical protein